MIKKITFSFITDMVDYFAGDLCGNIVRERWVNDRLLDLDSDAAELGCYFEYYFTLLVTGTGSLPKNKVIPKRGMYKDGLKPLAPYALAEANARHLKDYFEKMGLKIVKAGTKLTKGKFEGTIDLICECTKMVTFGDGIVWNVGDRIVIDLKYSGLIDDKWNKFGWAGLLSPGDHFQKDYHGRQAKQYHYVSGGLPFYFLVVSSTNETDIRMFYVPVTAEQVEDHLNGGIHLMEKFVFEEGMGFEARPDISKCNSCPLVGECKDKHTFPHPNIVLL